MSPYRRLAAPESAPHPHPMMGSACSSRPPDPAEGRRSRRWARLVGSRGVRHPAPVPRNPPRSIGRLAGGGLWRGLALAGAVSATLSAPGSLPLSAQARVIHTLAAARGLEVPPVWSLAQDREGFLWSGAEGGLFRFDGHRMRRWAPDRVVGPVTQVLALPDGRIFAATAAGQAWLIGGAAEGRGPEGRDSAHPLPFPSAPAIGAAPGDASWAPPVATRHVAVDRAGVLWLVRHDRLWRGVLDPPPERGRGPPRASSDPAGVAWMPVTAPRVGRTTAPGAAPSGHGSSGSAGSAGSAGSGVQPAGSAWEDPPLLLFGSPDHEGVLVATRQGLLAVSDDGGAVHVLVEISGIRGALLLPGGGVLVARQAGAQGEVEVVRLPGTPGAPGPTSVEGWAQVAAPDDLPRGRLIDLVLRRGTAWISLDRYLVGLRPGHPADVLDETHGLDSGGPLLVDAEASLWIGSFTGLVHLPEPDTRTWRERDGLPSRHVRFVARVGPSLWVLTWQGTLRLEAEAGAWAPREQWPGGASPPCGRHGGGGDGWVALGDTLYALAPRGLHPVSALPGDRASFLGCARSGQGGLWIATDAGVKHQVLRDPGGGPAAVAEAGSGLGARLGAGRTPADSPLRSSTGSPSPSGPPPPGPLHLEDAQGRLWAASPIGPCWMSSEAIGRAPAPGRPPGNAVAVAPPGNDEGLRDGDLRWHCEPLPDHGTITDIVEPAPGVLWIATSRGGTFRRTEPGDPPGWEPLEMGPSPTTHVFRLAPSPRGGIWVVANGLLARVAPDGPVPLRILETLGRWHGLAAASGSDLVEEENGTIWIASARGVTEVPAHVRFTPTAPPPLAVVQHRAGRAAARWEGSPEGGDGVPRLRLARGDRQLTLAFAALSFRDAGGVRHQVRLGPGSPWQEVFGEPRASWTDLAAGTHRVEYRASVDGAQWPALPLTLEVRVTPPWYASLPFRLLLLGLVVAGGWIAYRARVAHLVELERQRTRIALDLHDQVGSGLASVGLLSAVLADGALDEGRRRSVAGQVEEVAEELGVALSDIVWTLDPRVGSLPELAGRLTEHGERLLGRQGVDFRVDLPPRWPPEIPDMAVRRGVLLLVLEGIHNAARHAGARKVQLTFGVDPARTPQAPLSGGWWVRLEDDGVGFDPEAVERGRGLDGQRRRAAEIGARLTLESRPGGGTRLLVEMPPPRRRPWRRTRLWGQGWTAR